MLRLEILTVVFLRMQILWDMMFQRNSLNLYGSYGPWTFFFYASSNWYSTIK